MPVEVLRVLILVLLAGPVVAALGAASLGTRRADAIRWLGLAATVIDLVVAAILAVHFAVDRQKPEAQPGTVTLPTFHPEFVPGAPGIKKNSQGLISGKDPHATRWNLLRLGNEPGAPAMQFYVGLDGLNVWLVMLTTLLMVSGVLVSWRSIQERVPEYYAWLLLLETGMLGVFLSFDILLFYIFFELTLVPLFFIIGIWGGPQRRYAARKFFIYTLAGSVITLLGVLGVVVACSRTELTFSIPRLVEIVQSRLALDNATEHAFWTAMPSFGKIFRSIFSRLGPQEAAGMWGGVEFWVFVALMVGFAIKVPLVPLHTWLPLAHVEAPTAGSVILAGVLLKIGAYGFLRLCLPLAPDASLKFGLPLIGTLAVIGIVYGALCALAQTDIKKLVAYSSVSHMGFVMLGMFALSATGLSGSLLQMINHGLSTGALFLLVGMLYERYHTHLLADYGGMGARLRLLACAFVFICLTSIGLPGLNGFVGEVLVLMGIFDFERSHGQWPIFAVVAVTGIVLGAWYLLTLVMRVFSGPVKEPRVKPGHESHDPVRDLGLRETAALAPIAIVCVAIGVFPQPFLDAIHEDIQVVERIASPDKKVQERDLAQAEETGQQSPHAVLPRARTPGNDLTHEGRQKWPTSIREQPR